MLAFWKSCMFLFLVQMVIDNTSRCFVLCDLWQITQPLWALVSMAWDAVSLNILGLYNFKRNFLKVWET